MRTFAVLCLLASCSVLAKADQVSNYNVVAFAVDGSNYTGSLSVDVTTGQVLSFAIQNPGAPSSAFQEMSLVSHTNVGSAGYGPVSEVDAFYGATQGNLGASVDFDFFLPVSSFVGFTGSALCTTVQPCPGLTAYTGVPYTQVRQGSRTYVDVVNGAVTLVGTTAVTPEPSSLALLGTGLLGVVGVVRRRF